MTNTQSEQINYNVTTFVLLITMIAVIKIRDVTNNIMCDSCKKAIFQS